MRPVLAARVKRAFTRPARGLPGRGTGNITYARISVHPGAVGGSGASKSASADPRAGQSRRAPIPERAKVGERRLRSEPCRRAPTWGARCRRTPAWARRLCSIAQLGRRGGRMDASRIASHIAHLRKATLRFERRENYLVLTVGICFVEECYLPLELEPLIALFNSVFRLNGALIAAGDRRVGDLGLTSAQWRLLVRRDVAGAPADRFDRTQHGFDPTGRACGSERLGGGGLGELCPQPSSSHGASGRTDTGGRDRPQSCGRSPGPRYSRAGSARSASRMPPASSNPS